MKTRSGFGQTVSDPLTKIGVARSEPEFLSHAPIVDSARFRKKREHARGDLLSCFGHGDLPRLGQARECGGGQQERTRARVISIADIENATG